MEAVKELPRLRALVYVGMVGLGLVLPGCASLHPMQTAAAPPARPDTPSAKTAEGSDNASVGSKPENEAPHSVKARLASLGKRIKNRLNLAHEPEPAVTDVERAKVVAVALQHPTPIAQRRRSSVSSDAARAAQASPPADAASAAAPAAASAAPAVSAMSSPKPSAAAPAPPAGPTLQELVAAARKRLDSASSYQVHLTRQERVGTSLLPAEDVLLSVRRDPKAVRIEWPEGAHKGREVIYVADAQGGFMHVNMADSLVPVPRLTLRPDSSMAMAQSRHPITEAGFETIVERLQDTVKRAQQGDSSIGRVTYNGLTTPELLKTACHQIAQRKPDGETWVVFLDPANGLPAVVYAHDAQGNLLERYVFRDFKPDPPDLATAAAFDPSTRWGQPQGFLNRLARATQSSEPKSESAVTH
jgi:hypothetical protein